MKKRLFKNVVAAFAILAMMCQFVPAAASDPDTITGLGYTQIPEDLKVEIGTGATGNGNWYLYTPGAVGNAAAIADIKVNGARVAESYGYTRDMDAKNKSANASRGMMPAQFGGTFNMRNQKYGNLLGGSDKFFYSQTAVNKFNSLNRLIADDDDFVAVINGYKINYASDKGKVTWGGYNSSNPGGGYAADSACVENRTYMDLSGYANNGYMIAGVYADINVDLDSTYLAIASAEVSTKNGKEYSKADKSVAGVPLSRYIGTEDKGKYVELIIPLSDFDASNEWVYAPYVDNNSVNSMYDFDDNIQINWKKIFGMGYMKRKTDASDAGWNYFLFNSKLQIASTSAPQAEVVSTADGHAVAFTQVSSMYVSGYQITETNDGGTKCHTVSKESLASDGDRLLYPITEEMDSHARYRVRAIIGGTDDVRGTAFSDFSESVTGECGTAVAESMDVTLGKGYMDIAGFNIDKSLSDSSENIAELNLALGGGADIGFAGLSFGRKFNTTGNTAYYTDISDSADGYAVFSFKPSSDGSVMLAVGSYDSGSDISGVKYNISAVKAADYTPQQEDDGYVQYVIPLADFTGSGAFNFSYTNGNDTQYSEGSSFDMSRFAAMGFVSDGTVGSVTANKLLIGTKVYAPENFELKDATTDSVTFEWASPKTKVKSYDIYLNDSAEPIATADGEETSFTDNNGGNGFEFGVEYRYTVVTNSEFGISEKSEPITVQILELDKPRNFNTAVQLGPQPTPIISLTWDSPLYGSIDGYEIYRNGELYDTVYGKGEHAYTDRRTVEKTEYTYTMRSFREDGGERIYSLYTEPLTETAVCLNAPTGFKVNVNKTQGTMTLSWNETEYADSYEITINGKTIANVKAPAQQYVPQNVKLNTYMNVSIAAVNIGGAKSFDVVEKNVYIRDPSLDSSETVIYDDELSGDYTLEVSDDILWDIKNTDAVSGVYSARFDFTNANKKNSRVVFNYGGTLGVDKLRQNGSSLTFQFKAEEPSIADTLYISMASNLATPDSGVVSIRSRVCLADYISDTTEWQYVNIPFSDFPKTGKGLLNMKYFYGDMNFVSVRAFNIESENEAYTQGAVNIDSMCIRKIKGWSMANVLRDTKGNEINTSSVGQIDGIRILFDSPMNPHSLTTASVTLTNLELGSCVPTNGVYNAEENTYTMYLRESLVPNRKYSLSVGAKSQNTEEELTKTIRLSTAQFEPYTVEPQPISVNCTAVADSGKIIVTPLFDDYMAVGKYSIGIKYNPDYISPSQDGEVYRISNGVITFTGDASECSEEDLRLVIPYNAKSSGTTTLEITGSAEILNCAEATVSGNAAISISQTGGSGSGSGGSGSSGGSGKDSPADRSHGTGGSGSTFTPTVPENGALFGDISQVAWAKDSIEKLAKNNIINGYEDNTFRPQNIIKREEFAKMILLTCQIDESNDESGFTDVAPGAWYAPYISAAAQKGIIDGIGSGLFGVGSAITREDMCVMIDRVISALNLDVQYVYDDVDFADFDAVSDYAKPAVKKLYCAGYVNGSNGNFEPKGNVTRAMAAKVLGMLFDACAQ